MKKMCECCQKYEIRSDNQLKYCKECADYIAVIMRSSYNKGYFRGNKKGAEKHGNE